MKRKTIKKSDGWVDLSTELSLDSSKIYSVIVNYGSGVLLKQSVTQPDLTDVFENVVLLSNISKEFNFKPSQKTWALSDDGVNISIFEAFAGEVTQS